MIAVPFIYFSTLLLFIYRKNKRFDVSAYLVMLYVITSFFAILIDLLDLYGHGAPKPDINLLPTITYCFFLSITIYPFYRFKSSKIEEILPVKNKKLFNYTIYLFFGGFILMVIFFAQDIWFRITYGNFLELRQDIRSGELEAGIGGSGKLMGLIQVILNIIAAGSPVMLMFYFYSITFLNKSKLFNSIILLSSFTFILQGIIGIDRSRIMYYTLIFGLMFVLFKPYLKKQHLRKIYKIILVYGTLIFLYFIAVTISRFGYRDTGTIGGIISYAGQPFINYVYFFENLNIPEVSYHRVFPLFYRLFMNTEGLTMFEWASEIQFRTGIRILVFSTFIGDLSTSIGKTGSLVFSLIYSIVATYSLKRKQFSKISFSQLIHFYVLVLIPLLGIFVYFYASYTRVLSLIFLLLVSIFLKYKLKF